MFPESQLSLYIGASLVVSSFYEDGMSLVNKSMNQNFKSVEVWKVKMLIFINLKMEKEFGQCIENIEKIENYEKFKESDYISFVIHVINF